MSDYISPIVWSKPVGKAAETNASRIARIKSYRDEHTTILANGVRPIPKIETILNILKCHDMFEARLIVEMDDFRV
jgi:dihydroorotase